MYLYEIPALIWGSRNAGYCLLAVFVKNLKIFYARNFADMTRNNAEDALVIRNTLISYKKIKVIRVSHGFWLGGSQNKSVWQQNNLYAQNRTLT